MRRARLTVSGWWAASPAARPQYWLLVVVVLLLALAAGQAISATIKRPPQIVLFRYGYNGARSGGNPHMRQAGLRERAVRAATQDCHVVHCIALTFDDGPSAVTTPQVLDILEANNVPAAFFVVGSRIGDKQPLLQRMYASGYEVGNHTWSHADLTKLDTPHIQEQIRATQRTIRAAGVPSPQLLRPPYGAANDIVRAAAAADHMSLMFWNEDPVDWKARRPEEVVARVMAAARPGGVIIMHDIYPTTVQALPVIIQKLRDKGYQFATPSHMLDIMPGEAGDFYGRPPQ